MVFCFWQFYLHNFTKHSMNKYIKIMLLFSILLFSVSFQKVISQSQYHITYVGYIKFNETLQKKLDLTGTLLVNKQRSVWWQASNENFTSIKNDSIKTVDPKTPKSLLVYKNKISKSLVFSYKSNFLGPKDRYYTDSILSIDSWVITGINKKISEMECYKALTIFRGRAYAAWFNPNIPLSDGPWKFGGLPGLIIEIYDEDKTFYWKLQTFKESTEDMPEVSSTISGNFLDFKKEYQTGFNKYVEANKASENIDPTCATCKKELKFKVQTIENIIE
jgi:GLPGLI family protein